MICKWKNLNFGIMLSYGERKELQIYHLISKNGQMKTLSLLKATLQHCLPLLKKVKPYHNILEKNVWDDILAKYLAPNIPITSLILPPRKKATVQLPSRKVSIIIPSSSIITLEHVAEVSSWIDRRSKIYNTTEIPYEFKLLLRGSRDGFTGELFHRLCDNIPGTVVVVKIDSTNEILGGYNPLI
ncbi:hypothetical protein C2G38_2295066 [Gigaspora rosea]|uniref:TLDc domain-containing protein n=1 Tax=Gigaspora rosea TaxID=44941 RepID=A0A397VJC6_9GLOM|nr:hypothetical protein C2G38_2295066 [Gigaspora rosea]